MTYNIVRNELKNLFYSPAAWFIILIFLVQCGYFYFDTLLPMANEIDVLNKNNPLDADRRALNATRELLTPFFTLVQQNLFLYIPLLTMGLVNREYNNGSMSLLLSSPIKGRHIVFGKFGGMMVFNFILVIIIGLYLVSTMVFVKNVEWNALITSVIGFILLLALYTSIGLFMSSLSRYPIVAAISTFCVLLVLNKMGTFLQEYDFVRDITWFLSSQFRAKALISGLFRSRDVLYFLVIISMFIAFTSIKINSQISYNSTRKLFFKYLFVIVIGLAIGLVSSMEKFNFYYDATQLKRFTITEEYQEVMKSFDKSYPIEVTYYVNLLDDLYSVGEPKLINNNRELVWGPFLRFNHNIVFKYVYYYDYNPIFDNYSFMGNDSSLFKKNVGKNLAEIAYQQSVFRDIDIQRFGKPEDMKKIKDLDEEGYHLNMSIKYKGKEETLRYYFDLLYPYPDHMNIIGTLKKLLKNDSTTVAYSTGQLERNIYKHGRREYRNYSSAKNVRSSLLNYGSRVDTVNLNLQQINKHVNSLVIADPKVPYSVDALRKLEKYIDEGRNLMVLSVPGKQDVINPILNLLGLEFMPGQLLGNHELFASDHIFCTYDTAAIRLAPNSPIFSSYLRDVKDKKAHLHMDDFQVVGAMAIKILDSSKFKIQPIASTSPKDAWLRKAHFVQDSAKAVFNQALGDSAGVFTIGMMLTRQVDGKEQRIVVMNTMINQNSGELFSEPHSWLQYNEYPIYVPILYQIDRIAVSLNTALGWKVVYVYVLPSILFLWSIIMLIRRKRK